MSEYGIKIKNYKCFDDIGGGFDKILPINVIIGKNNSGKSTLIEIIKMVSEYSTLGNNANKDNSSVLMLEHPLKREHFEKFLKINKILYNGINLIEYGKQLLGKKIAWSLQSSGDLKVEEPKDIDQAAEKHLNIIGDEVFRNLKIIRKTFCHITADRDITLESEQNGKAAVLEANGSGATNMIRFIINSINQESKLIEKELLIELNHIVEPDIQFKRILVQQNNENEWEVFFENKQNIQIALSKMGSGIKTILLVLLNLIVRPKFEHKDRDKYVFAFEELENNLHPSLQRRLFKYIRDYSKQVDTQFFITTHSNIVIDTFGTYENAQILHVHNDGIKANVRQVFSYKDAKTVVDDLGLRASDILQSNGIIWVEGPSDRIYINKWLGILAPDLEEGLHYSIMFYGGRLLANLNFDFDWFNKEIIPLLKINKNSYVVLDRDGEIKDTRLNKTKKRIIEEIGENKHWITKGREIENYLLDEVLTNWLNEKYGSDYSLNLDENTKLENQITFKSDPEKVIYKGSKTPSSIEISNYITKSSINVLDLKEKMNQLIENIKAWNE